MSLVRILLIIFFCLIMLAGIGMIALQIIYNKNTNHEVPGDNYLDNNNSNSFLKDNMILNILLVGLDEIESESESKQRGRSDSMMIISVDARHQKIKVISIMRDLWVPIPNHGNSKLNAAYAHGGINLLTEVIKSIFGLKIDRYIIADFKKFEDVINKLGGIELDLSKEEVNYINIYSSSKHLRGHGKMHLDGNQALQFARDRNDPTADFKRTERQRTVISAIINKLKSLNFGELISFASNALNSVKTNFTMPEILSLVHKYKIFIKYPVDPKRIPVNAECKMINRQSVLVADLNQCKKELLDFIYEPLVNVHDDRKK